jgi:hypothetical protein
LNAPPLVRGEQENRDPFSGESLLIAETLVGRNEQLELTFGSRE